MNTSGVFFTFEGPEGAGKSTQIKKVKRFLEDLGYSCLMIREPGGTRIGNQIREILLNPEYQEMAIQTEILLYAASRAQLVAEVVRPALEKKQIVLCDRYLDSSLAYQSFGAMQPLEDILKVNQVATGGLLPHRTYLLDIPVDISQIRMIQRGKKQDRMEQKEKMFHMRVREGYLQIAKMNPERFCLIDATKDPEQVFADIRQDLIQFLER
jgi:dTMP kinase